MPYSDRIKSEFNKYSVIVDDNEPFKKLLLKLQNECYLNETEAAHVICIPRGSIHDYKTGKVVKHVANRVIQLFLKLSPRDQIDEITKSLGYPTFKLEDEDHE